jgi:hypothetical protein
LVALTVLKTVLMMTARTTMEQTTKVQLKSAQTTKVQLKSAQLKKVLTTTV